MVINRLPFLFAILLLLGTATTASAQEPPYFVTYSHHLEEPGDLEIESNSLFSTQRAGNDFLSTATALEYGVKGWWTAEFYLDGQSTFNDSTIFTGFRLENRFRPLMREHWINPLLYFEFEDTAADKTLLEIVNHDSESDQADPNSTARRERKREIETKLILSSDFKGWNLSENFINEKNLSEPAWEFGYAVATSRPLRLAASPLRCNFCRENFLAGAEFYGGLGSTENLSLAGTSHYGAAILAWELPNGITFHLSPGLGLNGPSHRFILRWGVSYELGQAGREIKGLFR